MDEPGAPAHDGHDHLRHLPDSAAPAVFAAQADVLFDPPAHADQLELAVTRFFAALSGGLADAGCTLVGHIKGTLTAPGHGDLAFHATALAIAPALTGGVAGHITDAVLTVNVIVFGVDEEALPTLVTSAWSRAAGADTAWRRAGAL
jgi:hypothetical protein